MHLKRTMTNGSTVSKCLTVLREDAARHFLFLLRLFNALSTSNCCATPASWNASSAGTCSHANGRMCCPGSQIISQTKTIWASSGMKMSGGNTMGSQSKSLTTTQRHKLRPYLSNDLQESLGVTGDTLLICAPSSYSVTSPVVCTLLQETPQWYNE